MLIQGTLEYPHQWIRLAPYRSLRLLFSLLQQFAQDQADIIAILDQIDQNIKYFSTEVAKLVSVNSLGYETEVEEIVRYVLSDKREVVECHPTHARLEKERDAANLSRVCRSLFFDSMAHRYATIPKKHAETFEWIF